MAQSGAEETILAHERALLDQWANGQTTPLARAASDDVSYFDDIGAQERVDGSAALLAYLTSLEGQVPPHDFEIVDPRVQIYGPVGILTLRYHPSVEGEPQQAWKATSVYHQRDGEWKLVHAHWSLVKES